MVKERDELLEHIEAILDQYNPMNLPIDEDNPYPIEYWDCAQDIEYILRTTPKTGEIGLMWVLYGVLVSNCGHCVDTSAAKEHDYLDIASEILALY